MEIYWKTLDYFMFDLIGGPRIPFYYPVNFQKCMTVFWVWGLMFYYSNFSPTALVYAGIHGGYGIQWFLKHLAFPDPKWNTKITIPSVFISIVMVLGPYWIAPLIIVKNNVEASSVIHFISIFLFAIGSMIMIASDCQKFFTLKIQKGLITTGMFKRTRNPNYLGECMIYFSFALLSMHWLPFVILGYIWILLFLPTMLRKEKSMSRYEGWKRYCKESGFILPKLY